MFTRSQANRNEKPDSDLGTSIDTTNSNENTITTDNNDSENNSDDSSNSNDFLNRTFIDLPNNMTQPTLGIDLAIRLIPTFKGGTENELTFFENKCELALANVEETSKTFILQHILSQLTEGAFENIKYHEFTTWEQLKTHLRSIYKPAQSVNYLQKQLSSMRQKYDENIHSFSKRIENIYHQLTSALTVGKTPSESRIIA